MEQKEEVRIKGFSLMRAFQHGPRNIVNYLMKKGPYVNVVDNNGCTALIRASMYGQKEVVDSLIKAGANTNAANKFGSTALMVASVYDNKEIVDSLIKAGVNTNAANKFGFTALMVASECDYKEVMDSLIKAGVNPYAKNNDGKNTLDLAKNDDEELKKYIIKKRNKYVIKRYKEYLIDGKNRMENLARLLQKEYDWYKPYWDEDKGKHDKQDLQEVKKSYPFPKDVAEVIAKFTHGISDDEWAQMRRLENEQQSLQ